MSHESAHARIFYADQEHDRLRTVITIVLFANFFLAFFAANIVLQGLLQGSLWLDFVIPLSCLVSIGAGYVVTLFIERGLKQIWHSGRRLEVADERINLIRRRSDGHIVDMRNSYGELKWYFPLRGYPRGGRERHVAKSWFVLSYQIQQDEGRISFFAFFPPGPARALAEQYDFQRLDPGEIYQSTLIRETFAPPVRPKLTPEVIAGANGRYWLAERNRWREGIELTRDDFAAMMAIVHKESVSN